MTTAGSVLTAVYLVAMMFSIGIGLRASGQPPTKRRGRLSLHLRALLLNLVLIPGLAVLLTRALHLSSDVAFALLLVAACPGGRFAPHLARVAGGDVAVATSQVLILTKLAAITAPLTTKWLLGVHQLHVAVAPMLAHGILLQMLPLSVGKTIGQRCPILSDRIERPLRGVVVATTVAALLVFLIRSGPASVALLGDRGWLAAGGMTTAALGLGWLLGGRTSATRRAFIAGGMSRNLALALLLARLAFPEGNVQLAVFGVWWMLVGTSYLAATIAGRRIRWHWRRRCLPKRRVDEERKEPT